MLRETKAEIDPLGYSVDTLNDIWASGLIGRMAYQSVWCSSPTLPNFYKSIGVRIQVNRNYARV